MLTEPCPLDDEQSPLSRAIEELEEELGVALFARTTRSTRLTRAGKLLSNHVPRNFIALPQTRVTVKVVANGFHGRLRIALPVGGTPSWLPALLALRRQEEPEVDIRLIEGGAAGAADQGAAWQLVRCGICSMKPAMASLPRLSGTLR